MDSESEILGSQMLRNAQHEAFARARVLLLPLLESARRAGYETMTPGNAAKIDRMPAVRARIKYLAGNTEDVIREKRERLERELQMLALANMDDFVTIESNGHPVLNLENIAKLPDAERRELMSAVKSIKYTENGPAFELHPKLDAIAQLRKINGLDAPEKHAFTNPAGDGPGHMTFERIERVIVDPSHTHGQSIPTAA